MTPKSQEKTVVLNELQRKRKSVEQLLHQLESYLCTPQTALSYEKREKLKKALDRAANNTDELLAILKTNGISVMDNIDNVERHLEAYDELQQEVVRYVNTAG